MKSTLCNSNIECEPIIRYSEILLFDDTFDENWSYTIYHWV